MPDSQVVFISGVSRGLGKAMALEFKSRGFTVAGTSRGKPDFDIDHWIEGDITDSDFRASLPELVKMRCGRIDVLINNAGVGAYETWEDTVEGDLRKLFELNFFSLVGMTNVFLPMLEESKGTIINTSSVAGKMYVPCMGPYCASKACVNFFSDSIRVELESKGVKVLNLVTGRINTGFSKHSYGTKEVPETPGGGCAGAFARKVFKAYKKGRRQIYYPFWYRFLIPVVGIFPEFYDSQNKKLWKL